MTQLLIDIGNSRIKWGLLRGSGLGTQHAVELKAFAQFERWLRKAPKITAVRVVCVAGIAAERRLRAALKRSRLPSPVISRSTAQAAGVTNGYRDSWRLGADRWVAAIGAWHLAGGKRAVCAVDVGTALTLDLIDSKGRHRGGLIAPGPQLMVQSLLRSTGGIARRAAGPRTSALRKVSATTLRPLADNTRDAIELGSLVASAALIDRCIAELRSSLGTRPVVYLTGGAAFQIAPLLKSPCHPCSDLVLRGLIVLAGPAVRARA